MTKPLDLLRDEINSDELLVLARYFGIDPNQVVMRLIQDLNSSTVSATMNSECSDPDFGKLKNEMLSGLDETLKHDEISMPFDELPPKYQTAFRQAYVFIQGLQQTPKCDYRLFVNGGSALEFVIYYVLRFMPEHSIKDIDFSILLPDNCTKEFYTSQIASIDNCLRTYYGMPDGYSFVGKLGNFDGLVPPTSQFKLFARQATEILERNTGNNAFPSIVVEHLIALSATSDADVEQLDVIPLLKDVTSPTSDISLDAMRRDFTVNTLYLDFSPDGKNIRVQILDPLNGLEDIKTKTLRTPMDPVSTFDNDPRRLMRIIKMSHKMLLRLGDFNLAEDLKQYLENPDNSFENAVVKFETMYPKRDPIQDDIEKVLKSREDVYSRFIDDLIGKYPYMFRMWCCPKKRALSAEKLEVVRNHIIGFMGTRDINYEMDDLSYNTLVTMVVAYLQYPELHLTQDELSAKSNKSNTSKGFSNFVFISDTKGAVNSGWTPRKEPYKHISPVFDMIDATIAAPNTEFWYLKLIENHQRLTYKLLSTALFILAGCGLPKILDFSEEVFNNVREANDNLIGLIKKDTGVAKRKTEIYKRWSSELYKTGRIQML